MSIVPMLPRPPLMPLIVTRESRIVQDVDGDIFRHNFIATRWANYQPLFAGHPLEYRGFNPGLGGYNYKYRSLLTGTTFISKEYPGGRWFAPAKDVSLTQLAQWSSQVHDPATGKLMSQTEAMVKAFRAG